MIHDPATGRRAGLWLLCAAHFMCVLDLTVVNGVLSPISEDLDAPASATHWVIGAYAVAFGGFLLVGGRAADLIGARRTFAAGSVAFALTSVACAVAPSVGLLVAARGGQGLSAALLEPAAVALLARLFPAGRDRVRALAVWGSVGSLGAISGMLVGGAAAELAGWRAVFLLNAPVGVLGLVLASRLPAAARRAGSRVDLLGASLLTAGCLGLATSLTLLDDGGAHAPMAGAAGIGALALFGLRSLRAPEPLVPRGYLRRSGVAVPAATGAVQGALMLGALLLLAVALVEVMGLSPVGAGLAMLGMRATQAGWARVTGRAVETLGARRAQPLGLAGMALGCGWLASLGPDPSYAADVLPGLVVLGLAAPFVFVSGSTLALECSRPQENGLAAGVLGASQWLGGAIGVAAVSAVLASASDVAHGVAAGFALCTALAGTAALVAGITIARRPPSCHVARP